MTLSISARRKKIKLLARYEAQARRDAEKRRNILIENLKEQRLLAEAFIQGDRAVIPKAYWQTAKDGSRVKKYRPKRVRNWFWVLRDGCYISLWYNSKVIQISSGFDAINIGSKSDLLTAIDELIEVVSAGDLDEEIEAVASKGIPAHKVWSSLRSKRLKLMDFLKKLEIRN